MYAPAMLERWITVTVLGEAIGFGGAMALGRAVVARLGEPTGPLAELYVFGLSATAGLVEGACLGLAQWLVLRRIFPRLPLRSWVLATAIGAALAWVLGMGAGTHGPSEPPPAIVIAVLAIAGGLVLGAVLGAAQALVLRRHSDAGGPWILASAVGWTLGLLFAFAGVALTPEPGASLHNIVVMIFSGAAMAIAPALATGLVLQQHGLRGLAVRD